MNSVIRLIIIPVFVAVIAGIILAFYEDSFSGNKSSVEALDGASTTTHPRLEDPAIADESRGFSKNGFDPINKVDTIMQEAARSLYNQPPPREDPCQGLSWAACVYEGGIDIVGDEWAYTSQRIEECRRIPDLEARQSCLDQVR